MTPSTWTASTRTGGPCGTGTGGGPCGTPGGGVISAAAPAIPPAIGGEISGGISTACPRAAKHRPQTSKNKPTGRTDLLARQACTKRLAMVCIPPSPCPSLVDDPTFRTPASRLVSHFPSMFSPIRPGGR